MSGGVEELLRAPQLAGPQTNVQRALTAYLGEAPQLKYPQNGEILSPFLFGDWNGDGSMDAAALYVSSGMQNVCLAILEQSGGSWVVTQEIEGLSAEVDSVSTAAMSGDGGMQLLVGYAGASGEKYLSVYAYQDHTLTQVMEQAYSQYELQDITGSGLKDLILIGPQTSDGMKVQLLTAIRGEFAMAQEFWLSPERFSSCEGLHLSSGADGGYYLVLDGYVGSGAALAAFCWATTPRPSSWRNTPLCCRWTSTPKASAIPACSPAPTSTETERWRSRWNCRTPTATSRWAG